MGKITIRNTYGVVLSGEVFDINNWDIVIRMKDGRLKAFDHRYVQAIWVKGRWAYRQ